MGADCYCGIGTDAEALEELTPDRIREVLAESAKGAAELHESLRDVFTLPSNGLVLK